MYDIMFDTGWTPVGTEEDPVVLEKRIFYKVLGVWRKCQNGISLQFLRNPGIAIPQWPDPDVPSEVVQQVEALSVGDLDGTQEYELNALLGSYFDTFVWSKKVYLTAANVGYHKVELESKSQLNYALIGWRGRSNSSFVRPLTK